MSSMLLSERRLRQILGVMWIIDGLLQLQPQMFSMNMINGVMVPMTQGQPWLIGRNLAWITSVTTQNLAFVNVLIATVQVGIGLLLVTGFWVRGAVIFSAAWAILIWYGGEGMSMMLTGQSGVLTGAPGAVLLYALIGLAVLPAKDPGERLTADRYSTLLPRDTLRSVLGCLWILFAFLQLQPFWWQRGQISGALISMVGGGGWDVFLFDPGLRALASATSQGEVVLNRFCSGDLLCAWGLLC